MTKAQFYRYVEEFGCAGHNCSGHLEPGDDVTVTVHLVYGVSDPLVKVSTSSKAWPPGLHKELRDKERDRQRLRDARQKRLNAARPT